MTITAKIGASVLVPLLAIGGAFANAPLAAAKTTSPTEASSCVTITHFLYFGSTDRSSGGDVSKLQTFLKEEGYLTSAVNGQFRTPTLRAVRSFQKDNHLVASGFVGSATQKLIHTMSCDTTPSTPLAIDSITGPTALTPDTEGTWTVNVSEASSTGSLHYSVVWGDEPTTLMRAAALSTNVATSSGVFTHTYSDAGTYTPTFTVTDDSGNTVTKKADSVVVGAVAAAHLTSLSPTSAAAGATITIDGSGFTNDSVVNFGSTTATSTFVSATSLTFTVPIVATGTYPVTVSNSNGMSNELAFTVTAPATHSGYLSINGIDAPPQLAVNEEGTWTVHVKSDVSGSLHYSVVWGDENLMARAMSLFMAPVNSTGTFTHTYTKAGSYKPSFTVTDDSGRKVSVGASLTVTP